MIPAEARVLLVEDSRADAQLVADMLAFSRAPRFELARARSLEEARELLGGGRFDVVLLDLGLPDATGTEGVPALRAAAPEAAIVVLTGVGDEAVADQTVLAGAQDYLIKGRTDEDGLRRSIRFAIARRSGEVTHQRLAAIVESCDDAIVGTDRMGAVTSWNLGAERLYGYRPEAVMGRTLEFLVPAGHEEAERASFARVLAGERLDHYETTHVNRAGVELDVSLTVSPIVDGEVVIGVSAIARDITERRRMLRELEHRATHDELTGLINRRCFHEEVTRQTTLAARHGLGGALVTLDLDDFKQVNDTHGHAAGDALLCRVAAVLRGRLRSTDVVARLGGDEFAALLPETGAAQAEAVARALLAALGDVPVGASAGVALIGLDGTTADILLRRADKAMYEAKRAGRGRVALHACAP